ncbi:E3 ubiquitin-protein ligase hecd-1 [Durusdinium trenchii]|uniref:E3 ubiquitin-protein ligase hecd-1 n=1 Tax=Durusdinium trenchii TaxID=1381693 RepID=A0ABP0KRM1_9DINO
MRALVVEFQSQRHRYTVELSNGSRKLIHAKNLQSITETMTDPPEAPHLASGMYCSISGLSGATHLNGQKCLVVSRKDGRYEVQLLDGSLKSIKPVNLTPLPKPPVGERVTVKNAIEGAMVQRGLDWIWNDQDGGDGCVGRIQAIEGDWACVQWNSGRANKYRIGADGSCDLIYVDEFKHENACRKALQRGKSHVEPRHLSRTFAYLHGTRCANVDFFDIRDEVCQAVGGCKHGQRVQVKGMQAVAIGVATLPSPLPHLAQKLEMFFHVERAEGAGIFDEADGIQMRVVGRQRVREAKRPIGTNNQELMEVAKMVKPSFQYMWGPNSYLGMTLERFDVRDEVCVKVGGFKHGQLVKVADKVAVVIGVRLMRGIPKLFFHLDGKPGSGTFDDLSTQQIVLVGTRKVEETADDFLEEPALSPEVEALAGKLECTFSFPLGNPFSKPARFDIRDNVCRAVGGFCHGQVVSDGDGDKAVVVGVKKSDGRPRLFFRAEGNRGAGRFNPYHLYRKELRVVGKQKLQEVSPSDPIFHRPEEGARMEKLLEALLAGAKRSQQRTPHSQPSGLPSDFEFDYSFHYLQKSCDPAFFDIRDEVCMAVGGYRHGDVVQHGFVDRKSVVIGVRPDDEGVPHLWMHRDGAAGASIFREMELLRMTSTVVGRKTVAEFEEPERDFSPEFIAGLQFTFNYPMGLRGRSRPGLFDIRDEVCLAVGGFKHGDRIKWGRTELAVVGVMLEKGLPEMHFQIVKPKSRVGAGMFRNFHLMKQHVKLVGSQTLEEVVLDDSDPTGMSPTRCSSTDSSEPEMDSESSSESESQRAPSRKMSRQASEASEAAHNGGKDGSARALVLRLSHSNSQVKNVLLTSKELDDCRRDVAEDGCEVTPEWANGAILLVPLTQEQARQARLELRSHHVVIFPGDKGRLLNALGALPCRQRPRIRGDEATEDVQAHMAEGLEEGLVLRVDRTFWTFVAPASEFSVNESAPCGDGESRQPRNPRQVA